MHLRHPYRATPPPPPSRSPRGDDHARALAWSSAVLLVLCLARIVHGFVHRRLDGEVVLAMALASAALLLLLSTARAFGRMRGRKTSHPEG